MSRKLLCVMAIIGLSSLSPDAQADEGKTELHKKSSNVREQGLDMSADVLELDGKSTERSGIDGCGCKGNCIC